MRMSEEEMLRRLVALAEQDKAKRWNWVRLVLAALLFLWGVTVSGLQLFAVVGGIGVIVEGVMLLKKYL